MTMNDGRSDSNRTTPPVGGRTMRQVFHSFLKRARLKYDQANEIQQRYTDNPTKYGGIYGAVIACGEDHEWRMAVGDEQFAERLAQMYGQAAILDALGTIMLEIQNGNQLLARWLISNATQPEAKASATEYLTALARSRRMHR